MRLDISVAKATKAKLDELAKSERRPMNYVVCSLLNQVLGIEEDSDAAVPPPHVEAQERRKASNGATVMLNISLQSDLKAAVKAIAKVERRTASNMASLMIRDWIEQWEASHPGVSIWPDAEEE
jgi:predicted transcriptional regulator